MLSRLTHLALVLLPLSAAAGNINIQPPVTTLAQDVYDLHMLLLYITGTIFLLVSGVMLWAIVRHRKAAGHQARHFHENTTVEIIWTVIPLLILLAMAWPATRLILQQKSSAGAELTIKVTGYQWKWQYDYLDDGVRFMSHLSTPRSSTPTAANPDPHYLLEVDEPLVVPTGVKVRLLLTANDVIHSWWVPQLAIKQDAIPGFVRDAWFNIRTPGTYRGQCTELCGKDHGFMPIVVVAKAPAEYRQWLAARKQQAAASVDNPDRHWTLAELQARGEKVFSQNCVACHQANGKGIPGAFPALDGSRIATGDKAAHLDIVINGSKRNAAMAAWGKQLSDTDIAAVISYERNAWSNHTGDAVQPKDVATARGGKS